MPLLPDPISHPSVKQFTLPKPDKDASGNPLPDETRAWVKMDMRPVDGADITQGISNYVDPFGAFLVRRIREWNFTDEHGETLPITYENVLRIGKDNIAFLAGQPIETVGELSDEQKKTSIPITTPS
jgi:hypothetical protein